MSDERNDFLERLLVIATQAEALDENLPPGVDKSRARHIASTARVLLARLEVIDPLSFIAKPPGSSSRKKAS